VIILGPLSARLLLTYVEYLEVLIVACCTYCGVLHLLWRVALIVACCTYCGVLYLLWCVVLIVVCCTLVEECS
jgi:hypothetical protein